MGEFRWMRASVGGVWGRVPRLPVSLTAVTCLLAFCLLWSAPAGAEVSKPGITILTHGYESAGSPGEPNWVVKMAEAIDERMGGDIPIYRVLYDAQGGSVAPNDVVCKKCTDAGPGGCAVDPSDLDISSGRAIILLDWVNISNRPLQYSTQDVAAAFSMYLFGNTHNGRRLAELPIHLIGHSRGAALNSHLSKILAESGIVVDQVTTLDPHPVEAFAADEPVSTYVNVLFADNYYQTSLAPTGETLPGAVNSDLSGWMPLSDAALYCAPHSEVHAYYHGSIPSAPVSSVDGCLVKDWYVHRDEVGYHYSRNLMAVSRPAAGLDVLIDGVGGTGARTTVGLVSDPSSWPNISFHQDRSDGMTVMAGENLSLPYLYSDRGQAQTIAFFKDDDTNPYDSTPVVIATQTMAPRPGGDIGSDQLHWTASGSDAGSFYVGAMTTNPQAGAVRYDYYPRKITVQIGPTSTPTLSPTGTPSPTVTSTPTSTPSAPSSNGLGVVLAPVPVQKGGDVCLYPDAPISRSRWEVYDVMGVSVDTRVFEAPLGDCWSTKAVAPGLYYVRLTLTYVDGHSSQGWKKIVVGH